MIGACTVAKCLAEHIRAYPNIYNFGNQEVDTASEGLVWNG